MAFTTKALTTREKQLLSATFITESGIRKNDLAKIQFRQTPAARVDISKPYPVQVDGDPVGTARTVTSRSDKDALLVRVPSGTPGAIPEWDRRI